MQWPHDKIIAICGPTASGKSALALAAALATNGIIINADSVQAYQEIPIISASPEAKDILQAPHALYGFLPYHQQLSVGKWLDLAISQVHICLNNNQVPIIVGGTGMYLNALIYGLNEMPKIEAEIHIKVQELAQTLTNQQLHAHLQLYDAEIAMRLAPNDKQRIMRALEVFYQCGLPLSKLQAESAKPAFARHDFFVVHVNPERQWVYENCNKRFMNMLTAGALDEVSALITKYPNCQYNKGIGVKELVAVLKEEQLLPEAITKSQQATRNYAKRQMTWFRHQLDYDYVNTNP